jgi:hypothetical protein
MSKFSEDLAVLMLRLRALQNTRSMEESIHFSDAAESFLEVYAKDFNLMVEYAARYDWLLNSDSDLGPCLANISHWDPNNPSMADVSFHSPKEWNVIIDFYRKNHPLIPAEAIA